MTFIVIDQANLHSSAHAGVGSSYSHIATYNIVIANYSLNHIINILIIWANTLRMHQQGFYTIIALSQCGFAYPQLNTLACGLDNYFVGRLTHMASGL